MFRNPGTVLIITGIVLVIAGLLLRYTQLFSLFGKLPGDIRIQKDNFTIYIPLATMIILSIIINILIRIFKK